MQAGGAKTRFGRCPYCRAMICQNTSAAVYYCSKCRTPIRGKNTEPTADEADQALSRLEILSAVDTASVFSDDCEERDSSSTQASVIDVDDDQPPPLSCGYSSSSDANSQGITASSPSPYRGFTSSRDGTSRSNGRSPRGVNDNHVGSNERRDEVRPVKNRVAELRVSSRRTRRESSASDPSILRRRDFSVPDHEEAPGNSGEQQQQQQLRRSALSTREMGTSVSMSGLEPSAVKASPLTDPAFNRDLLLALDKLRGMVVAIELEPPQASRGATTRRESRLFRRMESQLARELPAAYAPRLKDRSYASAGSASRSSASSSSGRGARSRKRHCFPVHGAAPFLVCGECSELLQAPNSMTASRRGVTKLRCGGCGEVLELRSAGTAVQARQASMAGSSNMESGSGNCHGSDKLDRTASSGSGEQQVPPLLLYRAMGFDSMLPLLHSQRY